MTDCRHIFISHAWKYDDAYSTVVSWLKDLPIKNYSVPQTDPLHIMSNARLKDALAEQIRHASIVIIISGMYAAYSDWMEYEILEAKRQDKYIIALRPWGQERVPAVIQQNANVMVGWNRASLIKAIFN